MTIMSEIKPFSITKLHKNTKIQYKGLFVIKRCFTNGTVNLQYGPTEIRYNIHRIKPYKSDTNVKHINPKNMYDNVNI